jgi:hypothetical protein
VYDFYIERPWLVRLVLGAMWGVDPRPFYRSMSQVAELPDGATVLDVPCGGGVAAALVVVYWLLWFTDRGVVAASSG